MAKKLAPIPERNPKYKKGLNDFINYINNITPVKDLTIVEVGAWTGAGSVIFANRFKKVICLDIWTADKDCPITRKYNIKRVEQIFDKRINPLKNVVKYKGYWQDFVKTLDPKKDSFDIVYVDMNKIYEQNLACLKAFYPYCTKFISGHDYEHRFPGVYKAVNKFIGKPQMVFCDTSWIVEVKKLFEGNIFGDICKEETDE